MAEGALISLGVTAGASAKDASIHKKMFGSGRLSTPRMTIIIISNEKNAWYHESRQATWRI